MQFGVAGGNPPRSAPGARPGAQPAYAVGERAAILDRPRLVECRLVVFATVPRRPLHTHHHRRSGGHDKSWGKRFWRLPDVAAPRLRRIAHMPDAKDSLTDGELQSEIELVGDLVVAASSSEGPLPQEEIDRLLGVKADQEAADQEAGSAEVIDPGEEIHPGQLIEPDE